MKELRFYTTFLCICSYGSKSQPAYHFWGQGNLQAPLRSVCASSSPNVVSSLELRQFDGCSNPHLGLAAILASGIDGLRKHIHVPAPLGTNDLLLCSSTLPNYFKQKVSTLNKYRYTLNSLSHPPISHCKIFAIVHTCQVLNSYNVRWLPNEWYTVLSIVCYYRSWL